MIIGTNREQRECVASYEKSNDRGEALSANRNWRRVNIDAVSLEEERTAGRTSVHDQRNKVDTRRVKKKSQTRRDKGTYARARARVTRDNKVALDNVAKKRRLRKNLCILEDTETPIARSCITDINHLFVPFAIIGRHDRYRGYIFPNARIYYRDSQRFPRMRNRGAIFPTIAAIS